MALFPLVLIRRVKKKNGAINTSGAMLKSLYTIVVRGTLVEYLDQES